MSETVKKAKTYASGIYVRKHEFPNGGHVLNVSIRKDQFVAWLNEHATAGEDFVRLTMAEKREADKYGSHSVYLDEFNRVRSERGGGALTPERGGGTPSPTTDGVGRSEAKPDDFPWT